MVPERVSSARGGAFFASTYKSTTTNMEDQDLIPKLESALSALTSFPRQDDPVVNYKVVHTMTVLSELLELLKHEQPPG